MPVGPTINWAEIRAHNGSKDGGFEELCAQLARADYPQGFVRKGSPDAGVECYAILPTGKEVAWQAKYLFRLGSQEFSQIDESVKRALECHPLLEIYHVCLPYDRPDARAGGQTSAFQKWNEHVENWQTIAKAKGMDVQFVYLGNHELTEKLLMPQHAGRIRYFFDSVAFDLPWFQKRIEEMQATAGPRYTPKLHVELPISRNFETVARSPQFFSNVKKLAVGLRKVSRNPPPASEQASESSKDAEAQLAGLLAKILSSFSDMNVDPVGSLPFPSMIGEIEEAMAHCDTLAQDLRRQIREENQTLRDDGVPERHEHETREFNDRRNFLRTLEGVLSHTASTLKSAMSLAENKVLVLTGHAGTGKTHLLCDLATRRLALGQPTILLMGQRYLSDEDPWTQTLRHLDLPATLAEDLVGALEAAAQASNCRALFIIDALNEGNGRTIWPNHLAAFLAKLARSEWITTVLAVRQNYEESILPDAVREDAASLVHYGFSGAEFQAMQTFFPHYGLTLPSSPILNREFSNPLFLKTLCQGLRASGMKRLPSGSQGISKIFDLYLDAIQKDLAKTLKFNRMNTVVRRALELVTREFVKDMKPWCRSERAEELVNSLLPQSVYEHSLYRALVGEGLLVEDMLFVRPGVSEQVTYFGYERLADHWVAGALLDKHMDVSEQSTETNAEAPLSFLLDESVYLSPGVIEALCIQAPERYTRELLRIQPGLERRWGFGNAFRQSIIWRDPAAFTDDTFAVMHELSGWEEEWYDTVDTLIAVATIPGHPFSAEWLHEWLLAMPMPDRDSRWTLHLNRAWDDELGPTQRLVNWAATDAQTHSLDDDFVKLCATTLAWMLTSSNRFLRDRATKSLVCLLTGRPNQATHLLQRFAVVDDLYVSERLYAVAYGLVLRTNDALAISDIAKVVYDQVFQKAPPAHVLLRDYARGVCDRANHVGGMRTYKEDAINPPYESHWPRIPSAKQISSLKKAGGEKYPPQGDVKWSRVRIVSSVENDDFARYVIGTNHGSIDWLSLRLKGQIWTTPKNRRATFLAKLKPAALRAVEQYEAGMESSFDRLSKEGLEWLVKYLESSKSAIQWDEVLLGIDDGAPADAERFIGEIIELESELARVLTERQRRKWTAITTSEHQSPPERSPRFDLKLIQRYVLWRVFDLGWTVELFGEYDSNVNRGQYRESRKAERIGKKYQWIAYHEIMALIADHFQYLEQYREDDGEREFLGPWQISIRDIDPSSTLRSVPEQTRWGSHSQSWWATEDYRDWERFDDANDWLVARNSLPDIASALRPSMPVDGKHWLNLDTIFSWQEKVPADLEPDDVVRCSLWLKCTAYLVRSEDRAAFMTWAQHVDFGGGWMPDPPSLRDVFLGEYPWSRAAIHQSTPYYGFDAWRRPDHGCPVDIRATTVDYQEEAAGFDCSIDSSFLLALPDAHLIKLMRLRWSGRAVDYEDSEGDVISFDPSAAEAGPNALLVREDRLRAALASAGLSIVWAVSGQKRILMPWSKSNRQPDMLISGAFTLTDTEVAGSLSERMQTYESAE